MTKPSLPPVRLIRLRRVFHNGEHNAFTDICRFKDRFYLTFRSCPDGHGVHPTSSIIVLSSEDAERWEQVYRFSIPKRDTRDPHFLIFRDRIFVYTGTWYCGDRSPASDAELDLNRHLGYAVWSEDGWRWHGPQMLEGTYGHYVWRAAAYGGKAYLCGRRKHQFAEGEAVLESVMLESEDGLIWRKAALFREREGDETAFLFEPDGTVLAVVRRHRLRVVELCRAKPPYHVWERKELGPYTGGPMLARWGDRYVFGGKRWPEGKTMLCWLVNDTLYPFIQLPSGGDNSYPGFVALSPTRALVSYYSSHECDDKGRRITAIYLAELEVM